MSDKNDTIAINEDELPRFTAAGRLVHPGDTFDTTELDSAEFVAKSTPVGNLTDEQLMALAAKRGLLPGAAAPADPPKAETAAEKKAREKAAAEKAKLANLDLDKDGAPGGSQTKAQIAAELTDLGITFNPEAARDDLAALLASELKKLK